MHVVIIGPADPPELHRDLGMDRGDVPTGLSGTTVNQLVRTLLDLGNEVTLITAGSGHRGTWRAQRGPLAVVVVPYRARARARFLDQYRLERRALAEEASRVHADVFHAHWTYEFAAGALASRNRPLLVTAHDSPWTILRTVPDLYRLGRLVLALRVRPGIRRLTAVSPYLAERWRTTMLYRRPIRIVPNAVPQLNIDTSARDPDGPLVLLEIADDSKRKNIPGLLRAFAMVKASLPDASLRLIGAGLEDGGPLAAKAREDGVADGVAFLGTMARQQVAHELGAATLFVHASLEESQGLCMLEALQAGLAVVAGSRSGGVAWTMLDGGAARLVDVSDSRVLADAVLALHADRDAQQRLVEAGQAALATRYAPEAVAGAYLRAYQAAIDDQAGRR